MEEQRKTSAYNDAEQQIFRLNNIWTSTYYNRKNGNLLSYKYDLEQAELELTEDIIRLDNNIDDKNSKFQAQLRKLNFEILKYHLLKKLLFFDLKLQEKHKVLKVIQYQAGKGGKLKDTDEDDWE